MGSITNFFGDLKVLYAAATMKPPSADEAGSFSLLVEGHASTHPQDIALLCEDEVVTWKQVNERANRVASVLKKQGIGVGDCVSVFMQNRIEFVVQILAVSKLGAAASLINTNLNKQQLVHCITLT